MQILDAAKRNEGAPGSSPGPQVRRRLRFGPRPAFRRLLPADHHACSSLGAVRRVQVALLSLLIGVAFGVVAALVTKHVVRRAHPHTEVTLILSLAYLSFIVADGLRCSGLMAVFFCGALCSHYAKYNLSKEGRETMHNVARTIAHLAETMVLPASPRASAPRPGTDQAAAQVFVYFGFNILPTVAPSCSTGQAFRVAPRPAPQALQATACGLACTRGRRRVGSGDEVRPSRRRSQLRRGAGQDVAEDPHPSPLTQPEIDCRSSRRLSSSRCACASCPARSTSSRSASCSIISPRGAIRADPKP